MRLAVALAALLAACVFPLTPAAARTQNAEHPFWGIGAWHWPCPSERTQENCIGSYHHGQLGGHPVMYRFAVYQESWEDPAYGPEFYRQAARYHAQSGHTPVFVLVSANGEPKPQFGAFARDAARALADISPWFEVWNEPNGDVGGRLTPQQFAYVLCEAADGLTADGLPVQILTGGLAAPDLMLTSTPRAGAVAAYLRATVAEMRGCSISQFAGVSAHLYAAFPSGIAEQTVALHHAIRDSAPAADLWVTEFGWNLPGDEATQAAYLREAALWLAKHRDACSIAAVMPFAWQDSPAAPTDAQIGLLRSDRSPKPAWHEYATRVAAPLPKQAPACQTSAPAISLRSPVAARPASGRADVKRCRARARRTSRRACVRHSTRHDRQGPARRRS